MKKKFIILIGIIIILTGCNDKKLKNYKSFNENDYNIVGYYQKIDSMLYQNNEIINSNNVILNEYMQIQPDKVIFSYLKNDEFISETYDYYIAQSKEMVIGTIDKIKYPMSGNHHIKIERDILDEKLTLIAIGPNNKKYHIYKRIDDKDYQIKYNQSKGETKDEK